MMEQSKDHDNIIKISVQLENLDKKIADMNIALAKGEGKMEGFVRAIDEKVDKSIVEKIEGRVTSLEQFASSRKDERKFSAMIVSIVSIAIASAAILINLFIHLK